MVERKDPKAPRVPATRARVRDDGGAMRCGAGPVFGRRAAVGGVDPAQLDYLFAEDARSVTKGADPVAQALVEVEASGGTVAAREGLAAKLCRLLPDLPGDGRDRMADAALRALDQLAHDHAVCVREALASAIKDVACAPPTVIATLARDVERTVAEPVLRCCLALNDSDLIALVATREESWALVAIAGRVRLSGVVAAAVAGRNDPEATSVLLDNEGAVLAEPTLERIVDAALDHPDWQKRLARRPMLPRRLAIRLATFVDRSVIDILRERHDFDEDTTREITAATRRRIDWVESHDPAETPERRARRLHDRGLLDEVAVGDALSWGENDFVRAAVSLMADVPRVAVEGIIASRDARAVTALCWRAGLSMRCAMQIQVRAAAIPPRQILNARRGTDYPMTPVEMMRTLELYGIAGPES